MNESAPADHGVGAPAMPDIPGRAAGRRTAHQYVLEIIRDWILSGALPAGVRLQQNDLAVHLDVSTTPVREALRDLAGEGLVQFDARRGAVVGAVDTAEMVDIYNLRRLLEPYATRSAVRRITPAQLDTADALLSEMETTVDDVEWGKLNRVYHALLLDCAGSPRLSAILKGLRDSSALFTMQAMRADAPSARATGNREHRAIFDGFKRQDEDAAAESVLTHLEGTMAAMGILDANTRS